MIPKPSGSERVRFMVFQLTGQVAQAWTGTCAWTGGLEVTMAPAKLLPKVNIVAFKKAPLVKV